MFEELIKRKYYAQKHIDAPLLKERTEYIQRWIDTGHAVSTVKSVANYLLRIIEFLSLTTTRQISLKELEMAANKWANYQYNHPQKQSFSQTGKVKFIWFAIDWPKSINCLEPLPEESVPLFNKIFERRHALLRHINAPLLEERLIYLQYWADNGSSLGNLRRIAQYLLVAMDYLKLHNLRVISIKEIESAADCWAKKEGVRLRKNNYSSFARNRFINDVSGWFDMLGYLKKPDKQLTPFEEYFNQYIVYMRSEQGLSENTIRSKSSILKDFLTILSAKSITLNSITPLDIDDIIMDKHMNAGYSRRTLQTYASVIRSFVKYSGYHGWCQQNLSDTIKSPRVYRGELLPYSPSWDDVKKMLSNTKTDYPTDIREYAILMLLSIYGMRCSEVKLLCLEDLDWENELIYLKRAKGSKPQTFPLTKTVGDAILTYLKQVRANNSKLREIFLCMRAPYRSLTCCAIYGIVSRKLKPLAPYIKHHGPHALRHACATHLINEGVP